MTNQGFTAPVNVSVAEVMMQVSKDINSHPFLSQKYVVDLLLDNPFYSDRVKNDPRYECLSTLVKCVEYMYINYSVLWNNLQVS